MSNLLNRLLDRPGTDTDQKTMTAVQPASRLLTGWGRTAPSLATVHAPRSQSEICHLVVSAGERGVIARGLGRSYGDPAQNAGGDVLDLTGFNQVHEIDVVRGSVTVDAGISLDRLMCTLVPLGYFVPVTPGTRFVTVGGAIACDIHGKNHHQDGSFSAHVESLTLLTPGGDVIQANQQDDPEVFQATAGGMGLTGIILEATINLIPISSSFITVDTERTAHLDDVLDRLSAGDDQYQYSVAWVDTMAKRSALGRGILYRGNHAKSRDLPRGMRDTLEFDPGMGWSVPHHFPGGLISKPTTRVFNEWWFRKQPARSFGEPRSLEAFFHQLDAVGHVNRVYGTTGFIQYQLVVPTAEVETLRRIIESMSRLQLPSFLTVLKRLGPQSGMISFPMEGWTLAVDLPTGVPDLNATLDLYDEWVAGAGGRVYLAKDSRLRPDMLPLMYPNLRKWRDVVRSLDPNGIMQSDLNRRLRLTGKR